MEMIRTIIVALFFAGITVCSYYFLSSSPFPWEKNSEIASTSGTSAVPSTALPAPVLEEAVPNPGTDVPPGASGPFAAAPIPEEADSSFDLPPLGTLPEPVSENGTGTVAGAAAGTSAGTGALPAPMTDGESPALVASAPALDTDLPPLEDAPVLNSPFDSAPAPVAAAPEIQVGTDVNTDGLGNPGNMGDSSNLGTVGGTDVPPALDDSLSIPAAPAVSDWNTGTDGVTNPLRNSGNSTAPTGAVPVSAPVSAPGAVPAQPLTPEDEAVRNYLRIASEKIQNGEALEVLRSLSPYYGNPRFSAEESAFLTNMLTQAATQVIYSQKSFLEAPYTVQNGDTLEKIAAQYQIPAEFIARVNGISAPFTLTPNTQLKVLRGPFRAIVYLDRYEMILTLNGLFAGRFWIGIGGDLVMQDGDYVFSRKLNPGSSNVQGISYEFVRTAGEPTSSATLYIQTASDANAIGVRSASGNLLMNQLDMDCMGALLGENSSLIMRCVSRRPAAQTAVVPTSAAQTAVSSVPAAESSPMNGSVGMQVAPSVSPAFAVHPTPAVTPTSAAVPAAPVSNWVLEGTRDTSSTSSDSSALPGALPSDLPSEIPSGIPAETSGASDLPMELPASL